jgi:hypothetical protein
VPGVYDVYYSWTSGSGIPRNQLTRVLRGVALRQDRALIIDVPMVTVGGVKQHNGLPFGYDGVAELRLRSVGRRGEVPLGGAQPSEFLVSLIPGTYTFEYDWQAGVALPQNQRASVRRFLLSRSSPNLILNVPSVIQDFAFLHNGQGFPPSMFDYGTIVLTRPGQEEVAIGPTYEAGPAVRLIPGTYDAHWRHGAGASVPRNEDAKFRRGLIVNGSPLVIDVRSVEVSGDIRLNGQVPPGSAFDDARLSLAVPNSPDRAYLGNTRYGAYQIRVVPGRYDVVYEHIVGAAVPGNTRATLVRGWKVAAQPNRTIDIPVGTYEGAFFLNGESFPISEFDRGRLDVLPLSREGSPIDLGMTTWGLFSRRLLPGLYRTAYTHVVGAGVPANLLTTIRTRPWRVLQGDGPAASADTLDVRAAPLTVSYAHNGVPLPQGGAQNARVHLYRDGSHLQLPDSADGPLERIGMEGRFDLYYQYREGPDLPRNAFMRFGCWDLVR